MPDQAGVLDGHRQASSCSSRWGGQRGEAPLPSSSMVVLQTRRSHSPQRVAAGATAAAASAHSCLADRSLRAFSQQPAQPVRSERKHRHGVRSLAGLEEVRFRGGSPVAA